MPLTDAEYLAKFGMTREEKKERNRKYQRQYQRDRYARIHGKPKKKVKKKGKKVAIRRKKPVVHTETQYIPVFTAEDLFMVEKIRAEAFELYRLGLESFLLRKGNQNGNS